MLFSPTLRENRTWETSTISTSEGFGKPHDDYRGLAKASECLLTLSGTCQFLEVLIYKILLTSCNNHFKVLFSPDTNLHVANQRVAP